MRKLSVANEEAVFVTVSMACNLTNLGKQTVRRIAKECHAVRKIGKSVRINREILLKYIDSFGE